MVVGVCHEWYKCIPEEIREMKMSQWKAEITVLCLSLYLPTVHYYTAHNTQYAR